MRPRLPEPSVEGVLLGAPLAAAFGLLLGSGFAIVAAAWNTHPIPSTAAWGVALVFVLSAVAVYGAGVFAAYALAAEALEDENV